MTDVRLHISACNIAAPAARVQSKTRRKSCETTREKLQYKAQSSRSPPVSGFAWISEASRRRVAAHNMRDDEYSSLSSVSAAGEKKKNDTPSNRRSNLRISSCLFVSLSFIRIPFQPYLEGFSITSRT